MDDAERARLVRDAVERWAGQQGHNQCWFYPDIFKEIAVIVDARLNAESNLPSLEEFLGRRGCRKYAMEVFGINSEFPEYVI